MCVCVFLFFVCFFRTVILYSDFFAGKRISPLATESYNSSINYNRQKPSVIFCVQFSTFLYKCAIFYQFMNKHVQWDGCRMFVKPFFACLFHYNIHWYCSVAVMSHILHSTSKIISSQFYITVILE